VKPNKKILFFVLVIVFGLFLILESFQSNQPYAIAENLDFLLDQGTSRSTQEKPKYHFIGIEKCASVCHNNQEMGFQYNIVKSGPHSQAFIILASKKAARYAKNTNVHENPQQSQVCLKCHVTGGGLDSTFFAATYKKEDGVTCEACHKGAYITRSFLPTEIDCIKCHNNSVHNISKFDFRDKYAKIAHPRPIKKAN
jgi:Cytochrome c554 and c-prime